MNTNIVYQLPLTPMIPSVYGPKDYSEFRDTLEQINNLLEKSGVEFQLIEADFVRNKITNPKPFQIEHSRRMIRCSILKVLSGLDYRELSIRIADGELYRWFARYNTMPFPKPPSKSTLERACKHFAYEDICRAIDLLNVSVSKPENSLELLHEKEALDFDLIFADSTCVQAHIHFPVDWVLLRDSVRTLVKSIICIRNQGLKNRMPTPENFLSKINSLCIEMSNSRRKTDAKKKRKAVLRKMKKLAKTISLHGQSYYDLLSEQWECTGWTLKQTQVVLERIQNIIDKLPVAIKQAHERIIGERKVESRDKLLSMYDENVHVLVRGKAGSEVEFGNGLYLAEQQNGLIVDWQFFKDQPPGDSSIVKGSIKRITDKYGKPVSYTADRGFDSKENTLYLEKEDIFNGICPRSAGDLQVLLDNEDFVCHQKRRAQTEGRIGTFKNAYLGKPFRCKGFENRKQLIALSILTHNLWVTACIARDALYEKPKQVA